MPKLPPTLRHACAALLVVATAGIASAGYVTFGQGAGSKWDNRVHGNPATITWGFVPDGTTMAPTFPLKPEVTGTSNIGALRASVDAQYGAGAFDAALQRAFDTWELVAGVTFVGPVADLGQAIGGPSATSPDIRVGAFTPVNGSGFQGLGAVGYGPPGDDINFPDPVAGDIIFNLGNLFRIFPGGEGAPFNDFGNDVEGLFLHELGHAAMGLGHPSAGPGEVMYVGSGCCGFINRVPSPDDITGARVVYGLSSTPACQNGIDDDGDGFTDAPADPGCYDPLWFSESPQCSNGIDDDGDTFIDLNDPQCNNNAWQNHETPPSSSCGFIGLEVLLPLLILRRIRRNQRVPRMPTPWSCLEKSSR